MSEPVPDRGERFTPNLSLRVPADGEYADIVTILGDMLDEVDQTVPTAAAGAAVEAAEPFATAAAESAAAASTSEVAAAASALTSQLSAVAAMTTAARDALPADQTPPGRVIYNSTTGQHEGWDGAGWAPLAPPTAVLVFTATSVWTKQPFAKLIEIIAIGGGAGAGTSTAGPGAAHVRALIPADALPDTVPVVVGTGGAGTTAASGTAGTSSDFGTFVSAGAGGFTALVYNEGDANIGWQGGMPAGTPNTPRLHYYPVEGQGGAVITNQSGGINNSISGGGGGGTVTANGGASGALAGGIGALASSRQADDGRSRSGTGLAGSGGGGGANQVGYATGGAGGIPGGGGGRAGNNSGSGGSGGRGEVIVITYF